MQIEPYGTGAQKILSFPSLSLPITFFRLPTNDGWKKILVKKVEILFVVPIRGVGMVLTCGWTSQTCEARAVMANYVHVLYAFDIAAILPFFFIGLQNLRREKEETAGRGEKRKSVLDCG